MSNKESHSQFFIKSGSAGFADRQKSIFGQLEFVEQEPSEDEVRSRSSTVALNLLKNEETDEKLSTGNTFRKPRVNFKRNWSEMKQFQGQESIFKRPDDPPQFQPACKPRPIPDYHKNPHKWTKYSLDDVSKEDLSNRSNTAAAFSFLREMAARKEAAENDPKSDESHDQRIAFKRPTKKTTYNSREDGETSNSQDGKPLFKSSKLIMPEYVIGQSKKKDCKRIKVGKPDKTQEITLNHLVDEQEEADLD